MEKQKNLRKAAEEKLVSGTSVRIQEDCLDRPSHTGKADCCGRDHHDHPGSGYQCNGFRNSGIH